VKGLAVKVFLKTDDVMTKNNLKNKRSQIYNCVWHAAPALQQKGQKKVHQLYPGNKMQISILGCASALAR